MPARIFLSREMIHRALRASHFEVGAAARYLGVSVKTLRRRLKQDPSLRPSLKLDPLWFTVPTIDPDDEHAQSIRLIEEYGRLTHDAGIYEVPELVSAEERREMALRVMKEIMLLREGLKVREPR